MVVYELPPNTSKLRDKVKVIDSTASVTELLSACLENWRILNEFNLL